MSKHPTLFSKYLAKHLSAEPTPSGEATFEDSASTKPKLFGGTDWEITTQRRTKCFQLKNDCFLLRNIIGLLSIPPSVTIVVLRLTKHPKKTTKEPAGPDIGPHPPRHCTPPRHCERSVATQCPAPSARPAIDRKTQPLVQRRLPPQQTLGHRILGQRCRIARPEIHRIRRHAATH